MQTLEEKLICVKETNDVSLRNALISEYQSFILSEISRKIGGYVKSKSDEAFVIGMSAFDEAITRYDVTRGNFLSFATIVINSRLSDYLKKDKTYANTVILDDDYINSQIDNRTDEHLKDDMEIFVDTLNRFKINLETLVDNSPKHEDTRKKTTKLGIKFSEDESVVSFLYVKLRLPITQVVKQYDCSKKTVQRFKQYIIAVMVIMVERLDSMKGFL